ncbi:MAG: plastocyanin/azurin family copper-binding protein, partial [Candidatus Competibacteraceae bacterium]|nr:plastocyanin/azurin family copper-binding protein [Candidatus Competibacteraceae bacterium]
QQESEQTGEGPGATVTMTNQFTFEPQRVEIVQGETVLWKNTSQVMHTVTAIPDKAQDKAHVALPEGAEPFGSGNLQPGDRFRHTFQVPGEYRYFCIPHEALGMVGTVVVKPREE